MIKRFKLIVVFILITTIVYSIIGVFVIPYVSGIYNQIAFGVPIMLLGTSLLLVIYLLPLAAPQKGYFKKLVKMGGFSYSVAESDQLFNSLSKKVHSFIFYYMITIFIMQLITATSLLIVGKDTSQGGVIAFLVYMSLQYIVYIGIIQVYNKSFQSKDTTYSV